MNLSDQLKVCVVMPCFNEENNLLKTVASFGFDPANPKIDTNTHLIIVDNNSTDTTLYIAKNIQDYFPRNVHVINESEQGYVPPRHSGNIYAQNLAEKNNWLTEDVLIIQADADTNYSEGYVEAMKRASGFFGVNTILEAYNKIPDSFQQQYADYVLISNKYDYALSFLFVKNKTYDVVVDDKQCAYRLIDYFKWGTHKREYLANGDELFAETTRLFIKARAKGAKKVLLYNAFVEHSARRLIEEPLFQYVTAGFPRERHWKQKWINQKIDIPQFLYLQSHHPGLWKEATQARIIHLIGMFCILPISINKILGIGMKKKQSNPLYESISQLLPFIDKETLISTPGLVILEIFNALERHPNSWKPIINKLPDIDLN